MKKKTYKIFGVSLVVMLIASMLVFAIPTSAQPFGEKTNAWEYKQPVPGMNGGWVYDPGIQFIGPIAKDKDGGTIYAFVDGASPPARTAGDFFISKDGYSWMTSADPGAWKYGDVVDMVCSSRDLETIYATDGNYVYKSVDGAMNWTIVAQENLELFLMGDCGIPVVGRPITCIDVGYNGGNEPVLFIGTKYVGNHYPAGHANEYQPIVGTVLWIAEETFPAEWGDLNLSCYGGCCDASTLTDVSEIIGYGDGATTVFGANPLAVYPVYPGSVAVADNVETFTDDSAGNLTGDGGGTGTIDYFTGVLSVTFNAAPSGGTVTDQDVGDTAGGTLYYSGTLTGFAAPEVIVPGTVVIENASSDETFTDTYGDGDLYSDLTGLDAGDVNYSTGAWNVTFSVQPNFIENIEADFDYGVEVVATYTYYGGGMGCFDAYAVAAAPNFADINKAYVLVTRPATLHFELDAADTITITADSVLGATFNYSYLPAEITVSGGTIDAVNQIVTLAAGGTCTFTCDGTAAGIYNDAAVTVRVTQGRIDSFVPTGVAYICPMSTRVISTGGTTCSWNLVSELFWDCVANVAGPPVVLGNPFEIRHASRFAFPDDFADTHTMFIGVTGIAPYGPGGDVYSAVDSPAANVAIDRNVQGYWSGCIGFFHANICSLDMKGSTSDGSLIAGAYDTFEAQLGTQVWFSNDGGWVWGNSQAPPPGKSPTGIWKTYVLWYGSTAVAGTAGCDCGFSMSCGDVVGQYWNQTSLIAMCITDRDDMDQSPLYIDGSSTVYMLYYCDGRGYQCGANSSLFRYDGVHWERVFSSSTYGAIMDWVEVSPDFNTTGCLYLANTGFIMFRSMDRGCSWSALAYPCEPRPTISAWTVVDEETVLAAGCGGAYTGMVYKTTRHGTRPWDAFPIKGACCGVDFDLSPNISSDAQVLLGDDCGQVFISEDVGSTWEKVWSAPGGAPCNVLPSANTYVQFDPSYGTGSPDAAGMNMIYAAAGNIIARCNINPDAPWGGQCWQTINNSVCQASGIDANGDTALYVSDGSPTMVPGPWGVTATGQVSAEWGGEYWFSMGGYEILSDTFGIAWLESVQWPLIGTIDLRDAQIEHIQGTFLDDEVIVHISDVLTTTGFNRYWTMGFEDIDIWDTPSYIDSVGAGFEGKLFVPPDVVVEVGIYDDVADTFTPSSTAGTYDPVTGYFSLGPCMGPPATTPHPTIKITGIGIAGWAYFFVPITTSFFDFFGWPGEGVTGVFPEMGFPFPAVTGTIGVEGSYSEATGDITLLNETVWLPPVVWSFILESHDYWEMDIFLEWWLQGVVRTVISTNLISSVYGAAGPADCTRVWRSLNPLDPIPPGVPFGAVIEWEELTDATIQGANAQLVHGRYTTQTDNLWLTTNGSSNVLWCLDMNNPTYVWNWVDPLANPVILESPACGGAQLVSPSGVTLSWEALDAATEYEIELYQYCPQCPDEKLEIDVPNSTDTCVIVEGLAPGTEHFWRVRVATGAPFLSKWSELCSFTTALGAIPSLCSPVCGSADNILTTNFSWDEVPGAASYELQIVAASEDGTADFTGAETLTTDVNAIASIPGLEYSTTYFWRVRAITGSVPGAWAVCVFTTMDEPEEPIPPADLVVNIPEDEVITPTWMWVLIGIGAALTIAVIILIVTTRRVP